MRAFGRFSYEPGAAEVKEDTIYDLASLTKVVVTTTVAMILVDEGKLDLGKKVSDFLPGFRGGGKEKVTVAQLLSHSSGIDWWAPLYKELKTRAAYLQRIQAMDLAYEPGTKSVYSDLGVLLLGEILERVAGESLESFARKRILEPLGMKDTMYQPAPSLFRRIAPTEHDPWRGRVVVGRSTTRTPSPSGGVAPHAGLFGTAPDLARFAQMLLNGGVYDHQRIVSRATVERFTRACRDSRVHARAGMGHRGRRDRGAQLHARHARVFVRGSRLPPASFGHTGFTGTSLWMDPEDQLFVILLTNRVHPTRENNAIRQVRSSVADAVVGALVP